MGDINPSTRVAVCCYAGDGHQVAGALPVLLHHECPVVILSPTDEPFSIDHPGVENRTGGLREYTGQLSLDRQREHLKILLEYPEDFFLLHDSDSVCLSPKIPSYIYKEEVFWSNLIVDNMQGRERGFYMDGFPRLAFQTPYFLSRKVLERLLAPVREKNLDMNPTLPFIDHYMVQLAVKAGVPWKNFTDGITGPLSSDRRSFELGWNAVQRGAVMVHSVKAPEFWRPLMRARELYLSGKSELPPPMAPPMSWSHEQSHSRTQLMAAERKIALARSGGNDESLQQEQLRLTTQRLMAQRRAIYASHQGQKA